MTRDIFSDVSIKDILDGLGRLLVALALGYLKLRLDSERRRRREHERRVASHFTTSHTTDTNKHTRSAAAGKGNGVCEDTGDSTSSATKPRNRLRDP